MPLNAEIKRLTELYALNILDSEPEAVFDSIVDATRNIFETPIAMIALIDQDRQWFKSCYGVDNSEDLPRDITFCTHSIMSDEVMVIPDATQDERFKNNPLVLGDAHIRFYAGAPLITLQGNKLGTLCIIDMEPHHDFDIKKQTILKKMAQIVMERILFRSTIRELNNSARTKNDFFATLSHEIRTPLGAVTACIHLFDKLGPLNEKQTMLFHTLKSSAENLESLVNDHLDYSKLENADINLRNETINCTALISDIRHMMNHQAESKNLDLIFDTADLEQANIKGDEVRLRQILINLVSNSIKYTKEGTVKVSARVDKKASDNGNMIVDITDTGIGIADCDLDKIFNAYERSGDKQGAVIKGTGLGLSITKQLVNLMGGAITVQSVLGKGSTFTVNIPVVLDQAAA